MAKSIELIATATFGLESVVAYEVKKLGYEVSVDNGKVTFAGDANAICRANLWLRSADRVLVKMGQFKATTFEELFQQTRALPWPDWLPADACFPVEGKSVKSRLHSVPDCQAIVKKAIVEKMKQTYKKEWFPENGPRYTVEVALLKDVATLTLDTSGVGLHKRGYRKLSSQAPLKETLAAGLLSIARWYPDRPLLDPFCGSGTIPIEAALMARNIAPGIGRQFAAEAWPVIPKELWVNARKEALEQEKRELKLRLYGTDIDDQVLSLARYHAREAGVEDAVHFQRIPVAKVRSKQKYGFIVTNPPYGQRLGEAPEIEQLTRQLGETYRTLDTWSCFVISSFDQFERFFGRPADKKRKLYNGRVECQYYQYFGPRPPRPANPAQATVQANT
ncbi:THUMP domain-containing class I SAM-dependent RNA methyltransferase [Desulforamulus hydrothermalis]|uniref:Putative RNA methyltransferase YpsC n=1 Tax=Desulforamulus hydrothermalis Lam5 = DSM 18033 TaxID=1121428 RepID=K8DYT8_9FIRM|nr:class I SAM-dependent RNA methyltransferase [Desulforamulus hydrothermalis]CCO08122.1 putative RNA methyltransferase YpsC [Desulforamulus hydrothermalis Lam5 = DSM 18033]SHG81495.1 putative N6-adenine-specific DNA methylase [Desulforamulus hydrothermalis Lam5 = DSM 18033]